MVIRDNLNPSFSSDPFKYERRGDQDVWEPRELRVPDWCPSDTLRKLIEECWHPDPNMRPSFSKILAHHTFPRILLEAEIYDPKARDFWGKYFLVETAVRRALISHRICEINVLN